MSQHLQFCQYKGHEGNKVKYICLDVKCDLKRSFCFKCLMDNHHKHGQEQNKNIYNVAELENFIKNQLEQLQKQDQQENDSFVQQFIKIISVIKFQLDNISNVLQELITKSYLQKYIQSLQNKLEIVSKTKLSQVDDEFINELVNMDYNQKGLEMKQQINEQCDLLLKNTILLQQLSEKEIEPHKFRDSQFEVTQLDQQTEQEAYRTSSVNQKDQFVKVSEKGLQFQMCSLQGHEKNKVKFICLDNECQQNKLICQQCIIDNLHKHTIYDHYGFKTQIQFKIDKLQQQVHQEDKLFVQRCIGIIKIINQQTNKILENLESLQTKSYLQTKILSLQNQLEIINKTKLNQVDDKFISQFTSISHDSLDNQQYIIQEIAQSSDILIRNSTILQQLSAKEELISKIRNVKIELAQIDQLNDQQVQSAIISNDLKYLACQNDKIIKIWNYKDNKFIQKLLLSDQVYISKFTDDSSLLYIGSGQGLLYRYDVKNNFEQTYKKKIHFNNILNLYCINNNLVLTSSFDQRIIKTNTLTNQELLIIKAHDDRIDGLDYNHIKDVIASGSKDNFIKLWSSKNGSLLIQQQNAYESIINQVLFINNCDQLISLDSSQKVNLWQIKYDTNELILIQTINDKNMIFNISLVLNQSFILLICDEYIKFYTIQGEFIKMIKHDVKEFYMMRQTQMDSIKSIIIQGKKQIQIFKMKI